MTSSAPDPLLGTSLGSYRVERKLGEGGMGAVYELLHTGLGKRVALKLLHAEVAADPAMARRFESEARAATVVNHPHIVDVLDFGTLPDGRLYLMMEFLPGESLGSLVRRQGVLTPAEAHAILIPLCRALAAVHAAAIVHRDLKPENIHLVPRPDCPRFVKVLDFGIARLRGEGAPVERTRSGLLMGTPRYMAPEQALARSSEIDARTDLYAVGCIAFEMLTGQPPFAAEAFAELLLQQVHQAPPRPSSVRPDVPAPWDALILRCLAKSKAARFSSAAELAEAIEQAMRAPAAPLVAVTAPERPAARPAVAPGQRPVPAQVGRFHLGERLGAGGMAEVFRATLSGVEGFQRAYAVKRILPHLSADETFSRMFIAEARLSAQLHHANIVATLDFDRDAEGCLYLAMEMVVGCDLRALLHAGALPPGVAAFIAAEILRALAYAHEWAGPDGRRLGIVHRDVSPHNVLLSWEGHVKLSDFGIAKAYAAPAATASQAGSLRGKMAYMSPEQARRLPVDGRADLFALGVVLHEMLTGQRLFGGGSEAESLARMLTMEIPPPRQLARAVPADLDAVTMRLLERDPDRRYGSAKVALDALLSSPSLSTRTAGELAALVRARVGGPVADLGDAPGRGTGTQPTPSAVGELDPRRTGRRWRALAAVAAGAAVLGSVLALSLRGSGADSSVSPAAAQPARIDAGGAREPTGAAVLPGPAPAMAPAADAAPASAPPAPDAAPAEKAKPRTRRRPSPDNWEVPRGGGSG